jgi:hypothetical protein
LPAPLKIGLSEEEDKNLLELQKLAGIPYRVKERAEIIRLRHYGWSVEKIAQYLDFPHTEILKNQQNPYCLELLRKN